MSWLAVVSEPAALAAVAAFLVKATLLLCLAEIATRALKGASAASRHLIWVTAIVAVLVLPAAAALTPAWSLGWFEVSATSPSVGAPAGAREAGASPIANPESATAPLALPTNDTVAGPEATPQAAVETQPSRAVNWLALSVGVWLAGAALLGIRIGFGVLSAQRMVVKGRQASDRMQSIAREVSSELGIAAVPVVVSDVADVPMAWGLRHSSVVIPPGAEEWSDERVRFVLVHELAHVRRSDCLSQLIAHITCAVHWLNPMVWRAAAQLRSERELACDALVLSAGARGSDYAKHLLEIARSAGGPRAAYGVSLPMARPSQLEGRLLAILNSSRDSLDLSRGWLVAVPVAAALIVVPLAAAQPVATVHLPVGSASSELANSVGEMSNNTGTPLGHRCRRCSGVGAKPRAESCPTRPGGPRRTGW